MTRRRLKPEELELWRKVAKTTERLNPERTRSEAPLPGPRISGRKEETPAKTKIEGFSIGDKVPRRAPGYDLQPGLPERINGQPVRMDKKAHGKLKRGKMVPEARIDLHGMTLDRAHPALMGFILRAHAQGKRLVLVITGKGKRGDDTGPMPVRRGVLRHNVPQWLSSPPLTQIVLQVTEAHVSHGGTGAYYVYLRRQR